MITAREARLRSVADYLQKAEEFDRLAAETKLPPLKKRYGDLAECYRLLASERKGLVEAGKIQSD